MNPYYAYLAFKAILVLTIVIIVITTVRSLINDFTQMGIIEKVLYMAAISGCAIGSLVLAKAFGLIGGRERRQYIDDGEYIDE